MSHWNVVVGPTHPNAKGHRTMALRAVKDLIYVNGSSIIPN